MIPAHSPSIAQACVQSSGVLALHPSKGVRTSPPLIASAGSSGTAVVARKLARLLQSAMTHSSADLLLAGWTIRLASRNRCLLWVNDALIPLRSKLIHLQDGDYVRVAIPPGGPRIDHIATRCLASAFSQGYTVSEILERHTLYLLGWYDTIIGPPHVPLPFYQDDSDVHTLFQHAHAQHIPELDQGLPELCNWHVWGQEQIAAVSARLEDEDEPLSESPRLSHWHRRAQDHDENDIERRSAALPRLCSPYLS